MEASYNNPHRAIEYLCNPGSMPAVRPAPQATPPAGGDIADATTPAAASPPAAVPSPAASPQGAGNLDFLRNHAQVPSGVPTKHTCVLKTIPSYCFR